MRGTILIADYDPRWPELFQREAERIQIALGDRALQIEHIGSTSVPSLAAKPIIDILLVVANSADESTYISDLEAAGYALRFRETDWYEHSVNELRRSKSASLRASRQSVVRVAALMAFSRAG